jgi:hypothetical protein
MTLNSYAKILKVLLVAPLKLSAMFTTKAMLSTQRTHLPLLMLSGAFRTINNARLRKYKSAASGAVIESIVIQNFLLHPLD